MKIWEVGGVWGDYITGIGSWRGSIGDTVSVYGLKKTLPEKGDMLRIPHVGNRAYLAVFTRISEVNPRKVPTVLGTRVSSGVVVFVGDVVIVEEVHK